MIPVCLCRAGGSFGIKSPADCLDYCFTGCGFQTVTSLASEPPGLLLIASSVVPESVTFRASGGVSGTSYQIVCGVRTTDGLMAWGSACLFVGPPGLDDPSPIG